MGNKIEAGDVVYNLKGDISPLDKSLIEAGKNLEKFGSRIEAHTKEVGKKFLVVGATITGALGGAIKSADEFDAANKKAAAALGSTGAEAEKLGATIKSVYRDNFGESIAEVGDIVAKVEGSLRAFNVQGQGDLKGLTEAAFALRDAFEADIDKSINASSVLMKEFGLSGQQASDFIAAGFQKGLNSSDDFLDSVTEYANQFAEGGASASQFFSMMETGLKGGVLGTDKAADAFKEFQVRILDGSDLTSASLAQIGISAEKFTREISSGNVTVADAFQVVQKRLREVESDAVRMQAGVGLIGTQFEDIGKDAVLGIDLAKTSLADLEGSAGKLNEQYNTLGATASGTWRQIVVAAEPIGRALLPVVRDLGNSLAALVSRIADWTERNPRLATAIGIAAGAIGTLATAIGTVLVVIGPLVTGYGSLVVAFTSAKIAFMAFGGPAAAVVAALAGIGWAVKELYDNWDWMFPEIKRIFWDVVRSIQEKWVSLRESFSDFTTYLRDWVAGIGESFDNLKKMAAEKFQGFKDAVLGPITAVKDKMSDFGDSIAGWFGHSTWIDYFENLRTKAAEHFGAFSRIVASALTATSLALASFAGPLEEFTNLSKGGGIAIRKDGEKFLLGAEKIARGGTIILDAAKGGEFAGQTFKVAAAAIGEAAKASEDHIGALSDQFSEASQLYQTAGAEFDRFVEKQVSGWKKIETSSTSLFSGAIGSGPTRGGSTSIQLEGPTLAGMISGSANTLRYTLEEVLAVTGRSFSSIYSDFLEYFNQQIRLWKGGSEVFVLSLEEWVNEIIANSTGLRAQFAENFDSLAGAINLASDGIVADLKRVNDAIASTSTSTRSIADPVAGNRRAAGGLTSHPIVKVGERGPELVALPVGSRVMSNAAMRSAARGFASGGVLKAGFDNALSLVMSARRSASLFGRDSILRGIGSGQLLDNAGTALARFESGAILRRIEEESRRREQAQIIERNARLAAVSSLQTSSSLRTGISGIDAALGAGGGSSRSSGSSGSSGGSSAVGGGVSININAPMIQVGTLDAGSASERDAILGQLTDEFLSRLSRAGQGLNIGGLV